MAENHTTTETRTVRELAREFVLTQDAYSAAYSKTLDPKQAIENRIDAELALDVARKKMGTARAALSAAQRSQVAA